MTIRTNPVAMSPQICRRTGIPQSRWPTLPAQGYQPNWGTSKQPPYHNQSHQNINEMEEENDYESGSVLYEQCMRAGTDQMQPNRNYFSYGEPTEEYYRNINMEFLDENEFDGHTSPPEPCPDTLPKNRGKHNNMAGNKFVNSTGWQNVQQQQSPEMHSTVDERTISVSEQSPVNGRRTTIRNQGNGTGSSRSTHSSEDSESDNNRWPRQDSTASRARRTRSKSGDRKFRNGFPR